MGGYCPREFCPGGILSGGYCPGGYCPGGYCPDTRFDRDVELRIIRISTEF